MAKVPAGISLLMFCKCVFLMLRVLRFSHLLFCILTSWAPPHPLSCLDGSSAQAHLSRCSSSEKKKIQFHQPCTNVITPHAPYKPVSRLTIWFQLNYLYTLYLRGEKTARGVSSYEMLPLLTWSFFFTYAIIFLFCPSTIAIWSAWHARIWTAALKASIPQHGNRCISVYVRHYSL